MYTNTEEILNPYQKKCIIHILFQLLANGSNLTLRSTGHPLEEIYVYFHTTTLSISLTDIASVATFKQSLKTFLFKLAYRLWDSFCFKMFLIYIVDNLGYIWIILYIVDIF